MLKEIKRRVTKIQSHRNKDSMCDLTTMSSHRTDDDDLKTMGTSSRLISAPYDEQFASHHQADSIWNPVPVSPCSEHDFSSVVGTVTGRLSDIESTYQIDPLVLGVGHHGSVRQCINRVTGQRYAVKSIRKGNKVVHLSGLTREVSLLQEMKHQGIIKLIDVFEDHEYLHLVTELCHGGELFQKIVEISDSKEESCFSEEQAAKVLYQILSALSYMHQRNIVHRDIKPENILFVTKEEDSPIRIIDFGLSRKHDVENGETPMKTIVGTPYYVAPEVLRKKYDKSCDLWSVGVIAYILLCGYPPFNGPDNKTVYERVLRGTYGFPLRHWKQVSHNAKDFIIRLLKKDPNRRMSATEALLHPWIVQHVQDNRMAIHTVIEKFNSDNDDYVKEEESSFVEVVLNSSVTPTQESIVCTGNSDELRLLYP